MHSGWSESSLTASVLVGDRLLSNLLAGSQHQRSFSVISNWNVNLLLSFQVQVQKMHSDDQRRRHGEGECETLEETRRFGGRIRQYVSPSRRRLGYDVDEHQSE